VQTELLPGVPGAPGVPGVPAGPEGPAGPRGNTGPTCSMVTRMVSGTGTSISCPSATYVIGGGGQCAPGDVFSGSEPLGKTAWTITCDSDDEDEEASYGGSSYGVEEEEEEKIYAICISCTRQGKAKSSSTAGKTTKPKTTTTRPQVKSVKSSSKATPQYVPEEEDYE